MTYNQRYPVEMHEYAQSTGALLANRISNILEKLGFEAWTVKGQNNGIDMKVWYKGNLVMTCEILNWSPYTRLSIRRKKRIIRNLTNPQHGISKRVLIYTAMKDETVIQDLPAHGISIVKIGCQILPKHFYKFYRNKNQTTCRQIDSIATNAIIEAKLRNFIDTLNLDDYLLATEEPPNILCNIR
jgi:hypothetical protein